MVFACSLCRAQCEEYCFFSTHCSDCEEIRRIISLYDRKDVLNTLRMVYLRDDEKKRINRTIKKQKIVTEEKKPPVEEQKKECDQTEEKLQVITRSKVKAK